MPDLTILPARPVDLPALHQVIERAYRGESARAGWTHEADIITEGARTDLDTLTAIVADPAQRLLIAHADERVVGCVTVANRGDRLAYLGLLCVDPMLQATGMGRTLVQAAEAAARTEFGADRIEMTVIEQRAELIAWYVRLGYAPSGERRDFPIAMSPPLYMTVLVKALDLEVDARCE